MISVRKTVFLVIQVISIICSFFIFRSELTIQNDFAFYGYYGLFITILNLILLLVIQKRIITGVNVIYICFCLFQFGLPIVTTLDKNFASYYLSILPSNIKVLGEQFSILCIQFFALGILLFINHKYKKMDISFPYLKRKELIIRASKLLAVLTGCIVIPLYVIVASQTIVSGYSQQLRASISSNGLFNVATALFLPACFLILCYENSTKQLFLKTVVLITCILSLIVGDRTNGIGWLLAFLLFRYFENSAKNDTKSIFKIIVIVTSIVALVYLSSFLGYARMDDQMESLNPLRVLELFIAELGFNFTTICFVMMYVPSITVYQYGKTYVDALILLIPKSLDPTGTINNMLQNLPHKWLYSLIHITYNGGLDFGVGFSTIAEAFLNFGWLGVIIVFILGAIVGNFFGWKNWQQMSSFSKYSYIVLVAGLLTFPRRTAYEFFKVYEYSIIFILVYLWVAYSIFKRSK